MSYVAQVYTSTAGSQWVCPGREAITPGGFTPPPDPDPVGFAHPGVLIGPDELAHIKAQAVVAGTQTSAGWSRMVAAKTDLSNSLNVGKTYLDPSWTPRPWAYVGRGSGGSNSEGDHDEQADSIAAYANALAWHVTGTRSYATKAIQIMNAWSPVLIDHKFDWPSPGLYLDGLLQAGWTGAVWPRAAEIIKHTFVSTGAEPVFDHAGFAAMLQRAHVPRVKWGWKGGQANWLLVMADALMQIAVYCDDRPMYDLALRNFRAWVPAAIWQVGDVNDNAQLAGYPISPDTPPGAPWPGDYDNATRSVSSFRTYWYNPTSNVPWINGLQQEAGRDAHHAAMSFASIGNMAETARVQGDDLWGEFRTRLLAGVELHAGWMYAGFVQGNTRPTGWPFAASLNVSTPTSFQRITYYAMRMRLNQMGFATPNTNNLLTGFNDNTSYVASLHSAFEKLTFSTTPAVTVPPVVVPPADPNAMPTASIPGWTYLRGENFNTDFAVGGYRAAMGIEWDRYHNFLDTSDNGRYRLDLTASVTASVLKIHMHKVAGQAQAWCGAPTPWDGIPQLYGRYSVRWRTTGNSVDGDFKVAWLLWPTTEIWDDGEIDFPECDLGDNIKGYSHDTVTDPSDNILAYQNGTYSSLDWHITTIEWTPTRVTFFIDGTQVAQTTNPAGIPTVPMRWVLQSETNLTSSHVPTDGSEADILIDWVAAWAYTP